MAPRSGGPGRSQRLELCAGSNAVGGNSSSTQRWNDVPRGTMDEVSSYVRLAVRSSHGKAVPQIVPPYLRIPRWKGPSADSEEKREPASDIDTAQVNSLKVLDPEWPIREADIDQFAVILLVHALVRKLVHAHARARVLHFSNRDMRINSFDFPDVRRLAPRRE